MYIIVAEERHSLLGGCYQSNSDMSTNLCDIEDSECETEQKPLNYMTGRVVHQTDVWQNANGPKKKVRFLG